MRREGGAHTDSVRARDPGLRMPSSSGRAINASFAEISEVIDVKSFDHFVVSSIQSRKSLRLPSLISRRTESPATIKARAADERGRLSPHSTSGSDSRTSRKLVNFRTLTWQSSQGESKEDSGPPTF